MIEAPAPKKKKVQVSKPSNVKPKKSKTEKLDERVSVAEDKMMEFYGFNMKTQLRRFLYISKWRELNQ